MKSTVDIIILRGAPGSGKSTTSKELAKLFPGGVRLEVDTLRAMVNSVDWKNQQEHINLLSLSTKVAREFLDQGYKPVIIVDTFSGNKLEGYLKQLQTASSKLDVKIIGLTVSEDVLLKRIDLRSEDEFKEIDVCRKLNRDVLKRPYDGEILIDTSPLLPMQTAAKIKSILES